MYDERGRPVNPETKRINKDVVRSHNEVMLVIGVAEPENGGLVDSQTEARLKQQFNEDKIGRRLWDVGITLHLGGFWAVNGLRQKLFVSGPKRLWHLLTQIDLSLIFSRPVRVFILVRAESAVMDSFLLGRLSCYYGERGSTTCRCE